MTHDIEAISEAAELTHADLRRDAMIDMLNATCQAFDVRVEFWKDTAQRLPRVIRKKSQEREVRLKLIECKIRADEIRALQKLMRATMQTCIKDSGRELVKGCSLLPWKLVEDEGYFAIMAADGYPVVAGGDTDKDPSNEGCIDLEANGQMIIDAVNLFAPVDGYLEPGQTVKPQIVDAPPSDE